MGGLITALVVCGALAWGALRVSSRLPESVGGLARLDASLAIALLFIVLLTTGLGALGLLHRWVVLPAALLLSLAMGLVPVRATARTVYGRVRNAIADGCRVEPGVLLAAVPGLVAVALAVGYALTRPPLGYDALNYHLPLAAHYL